MNNENKIIRLNLNPVEFINQSKKELSVLATQFAENVAESGMQDPLEIYIMAGKMAHAFGQIQDNLHDQALTEAAKHGKSHKQHNTKVEIKDVGVRYDFGNCGCSKLEKLEEEMAVLKEKIFKRQAFLKTLGDEGLTVVNEDTGEVDNLRPPIKKGKEKVTLTY